MVQFLVPNNNYTGPQKGENQLRVGDFYRF